MGNGDGAKEEEEERVSYRWWAALLVVVVRLGAVGGYYVMHCVMAQG
jgi:hypothetical protein